MNESGVITRTIEAGPREATEQHTSRYADLRDRRLAATLGAEDIAEDGGLDPFERISCRIHRRWLHQCIHSQVHVVQVSGHRWCRSCDTQAAVAVDELTGDVRVRCTRCGRTPAGRASRQIVRTCTASLAAAQDDATP
jgi:hypothetical protein